MDDKISLERLRLAIEAAPTGMVMLDPAGKIVLVNAQFERLFGYRREEVIGRSIEMFVPERFRAGHPQLRAGFHRQPRARPMGEGRDLYGLRKDGTEVPVEIGLNPFDTREGEFVLGSVVDITLRKRAEGERDALLAKLSEVNEQLRERVRHGTAQLEEREALLQELHHRVKNNLQIITSLINLQQRKLADPGGRLALAECGRRVQAIAMIHEMLYQSKDYASVPFSEYVRTLAQGIVHAYAGASRASLALDLGDVYLGIDQAIPCGLLLNELITNALKHAFPAGRQGTISVKLAEVEPGMLSLLVRDDGVGMPPTFARANGGSLGLQLVDTLARQIRAQVLVNGEGGTAFELRFPAEPVPPSSPHATG